MRFSGNAIAVVACSLTQLLVIDLLIIGSALAQPSLPSDAEIGEQMAKQKRAMEQALSSARRPPAQAPTMKVEVPSIAPPPQRTDNIMELVDRYANSSDGRSIEQRADVDLMFFVSLSMPAEVLKELSRQAREAGAVLMLRGFKDGKQSRTKQAIRAVNEAGAEWDIHPEAFKMFKVKAVPTFVVANANASSVLDDGCSPEVSYGSVTGNMSVDLALDTIKRRGSPQAAQMAEARIKLLQQRRNAGS